ncbi:hypothetical protein OYC64_003449 [Pagothenia borchgrevinki]|uniref:Uncharacterized protein n=1 Tax=Pagothenia borchgrevinki TaxID=8213 RepID=A0ABD2FPB2_PAGBO
MTELNAGSTPGRNSSPVIDSWLADERGRVEGETENKRRGRIGVGKGEQTESLKAPIPLPPPREELNIDGRMEGQRGR